MWNHSQVLTSIYRRVRRGQHGNAGGCSLRCWNSNSRRVLRRMQVHHFFFFFSEGAHSSEIGFPENEASMVRRWLHHLEPVKYLENLGNIDHCACFPRNQSQRTSVEGEILTIPPTQFSPVRKQPGMSSNGSKIRTKLLVQAYLSLSEAQYRGHNHRLQPPPKGQEQEQAGTISDHPINRHPACWVASAACVNLFCFALFYFPGFLPRWALSAEVHPGRDPLASGQEASSNPILTLNDRWSRRRIIQELKTCPF